MVRSADSNPPRAASSLRSLEDAPWSRDDQARQSAAPLAPDYRDALSRLWDDHLDGLPVPSGLEAAHRLAADQLRLRQQLDAMAELARSERFLSELSVKRYQTLLHDDPADVDAWVTLAALHERLGDAPAACDALEHALELAPDHPLALAHWKKIWT